jgi:GT2 family glycosyltransferase
VIESLTVVIPNRETPVETVASAQSAIAEGVPADRIVIVDDSSADDSLERIRERLPEAVLVPLDRHAGYAHAANEGARRLPGEHYLLLNSDAFVHRHGSIQTLLAALDDERVGIVVPRVLNEDLSLQPTVAPAHSPAVALVRASGLSRLVPNRWQPRWSTHWDHASSREIETVVGAVLLVRGKTWDVLGGLDERSLMYAEDHDLCWRAREAGWKVWFAHEAEFVHLGNRSGKRLWSSPDRAELVGRSEGRMIRRHLPGLAGAATVALMCAGIAARWLVYAAIGRRAAQAEMRGSLKGLAPSVRRPH